MNVISTLRYTKDHEWVANEDGLYRVGITDFAQHELGDIVFVELPEVGTEVESGESFGSVESVKTVSELYSPVSGVVKEVNFDLEGQPELVNESPYEKAWMIVIEPTNPDSFDGLLSADEYKEII